MLSPYFDHVERELRTAVRHQAHRPWFVRLRDRRARPLVVVLACLVIAGPAFAAATLLQQGTQVGPNVPPTPSAFEGVAIKSSIELLPLRTADPAGGPPWGMRMVRTTRGLLCLQVGRVAFGTVGALGRDDAFQDDGRFHPFSPDYVSGPPCSTPDARGNAFINVATWGVAASGLLFGESPHQGCVPPRIFPNLPPAMQQGIAPLRRQGPLCPTADLRNVFYGLLGPDAVSITYWSPSGKLVTAPTGPDGSYLIVGRGGLSTNNDGYTYDAGTVRGPITAIRYRDGHTCHPGRCEPVGYAAPTKSLPTPGQVASPISTRVELAKVWCAPVSGTDRRLPEPCPRHLPAGFERLSRQPPAALIVFSFISRVPVTNGHSYYYFTLSCGKPGAGGGFGQTNSDYAAGQRVVQWMFEGCSGVVYGNVTLVITTGPSAPAPMPAVRGQSVGREVGRFTVKIPDLGRAEDRSPVRDEDRSPVRE